MRADETIACAKPGLLGDDRSEHRFHLGIPRAPRSIGAVIEIDVIGGRADDPEAAEVVAQRLRNHASDQGILGKLLRGLERDVAGRRVEMEDAGENQLDRAPFGADDEIDVLRVSVETAGDLAVYDHDEPDRAHPERKEQDVQQRAERTRPQVTPGELQEIHAACRNGRRGRASCRSTRDLRRVS